MANSYLIIPFLTDDPQFTHGYECGLLDNRMRNGEFIEKQPVHTANIEQIRLIAEHYGYDLHVKAHDDTWSTLDAKPIDITNLLK